MRSVRASAQFACAAAIRCCRVSPSTRPACFALAVASPRTAVSQDRIAVSTTTCRSWPSSAANDVASVTFASASRNRPVTSWANDSGSMAYGNQPSAPWSRSAATWSSSIATAAASSPISTPMNPAVNRSSIASAPPPRAAWNRLRIGGTAAPTSPHNRSVKPTMASTTTVRPPRTDRSGCAH